MRPIVLTVVIAALFSCASWRRAEVASVGCAAVEPDDPKEPLYAEARDLLLDPRGAEMRKELGISGSASDVVWLTDREVCERIRSTLRLTPADPPVAAVRAGTHILAHPRPDGARYVFGADGKLVTVFTGT
jgi:hypothetical protein